MNEIPEDNKKFAKFGHFLFYKIRYDRIRKDKDLDIDDSKRVVLDLLATKKRRSRRNMGRIRFVDAKTKRSIVSCNECRRRKKRCDEKRPKCSDCIKRDADCTYQKDNDERLGGIYSVVKKKIELKNNTEYSRDVVVQNIETTRWINYVGKDSTGFQLQEDAGDGDTECKDETNSTDGEAGGEKSENKAVAVSAKPSFEINADFIEMINSTMNIGTGMNMGYKINVEMGWNKSVELTTVNPVQLDLHELSSLVIEAFKKKNLNTKNNKFIESFKVLVPFANSSAAIKIILSSWILIMNNEISQSSQLFHESLRINEELEFKIEYSGEWNEFDLIDYLVCLIIQNIISSITNNIRIWKLSFEKLFSMLKKIGLKMLKMIIRDKKNKRLLSWVMNWFFYQDIFKMVKVTDKRILGPVFSKKEYYTYICKESNEEDEYGSNEQDIKSYCINLHIILGEINSLYDKFSIRIKDPINRYYKEIYPVMKDLEAAGNDEELIRFVNSEMYLRYEMIRSKFHDWVQETTSLLEKKIVSCSIEAGGSATYPINKDLLEYFELMKLSVLLYMKFKIKELSAPSYEIKNIVLKIFSKFRNLVDNRKFNNSLLFPLLIVGANVCEERDRIMVKGFYRVIKDNSECINIEQVWKIILEFWKLNPNGLSFEMWQNIINKYDWNVCII